MSLENFEFDTYFDELRESLEASRGDCKEIVLKIPDFLDLFVELLRDTEKIGGGERKLINAAIAYTLAPYDVKPEKVDREADKMGILRRVPLWARKRGTKIRKTEEYIDDAFLCSEVLSRLKGNVDERLVKSCWKGERDVFELVEEVIEELREELDKGTRKAIIEYAGLEK